MNLLYSEETILSLLPHDPALSERLMLGRIIRDISRFALVRVDQGSNSLQIHRLVQAQAAFLQQDQRLAHADAISHSCSPRTEA